MMVSGKVTRRDFDALGMKWACWIDLLGETCLLVVVRFSWGDSKSDFEVSVRHTSSRVALAAWVSSFQTNLIIVFDDDAGLLMCMRYQYFGTTSNFSVWLKSIFRHVCPNQAWPPEPNLPYKVTRLPLQKNDLDKAACKAAVRGSPNPQMAIHPFGYHRAYHGVLGIFSAGRDWVARANPAMLELEDV